MSTTWSHLCLNTNTFSLMRYEEQCKSCGTNYAVQSVRYDRFTALPITPHEVNEGVQTRQLAALFKPKTKRDETPT